MSGSKEVNLDSGEFDPTTAETSVDSISGEVFLADFPRLAEQEPFEVVYEQTWNAMCASIDQSSQVGGIEMQGVSLQQILDRVRPEIENQEMELDSRIITTGIQSSRGARQYDSGFRKHLTNMQFSQEQVNYVMQAFRLVQIERHALSHPKKQIEHHVEYVRGEMTHRIPGDPVEFYTNKVSDWYRSAEMYCRARDQQLQKIQVMETRMFGEDRTVPGLWKAIASLHPVNDQHTPAEFRMEALVHMQSGLYDEAMEYIRQVAEEHPGMFSKMVFDDLGIDPSELQRSHEEIVTRSDPFGIQKDIENFGEVDERNMEHYLSHRLYPFNQGTIRNADGDYLRIHFVDTAREKYPHEIEDHDAVETRFTNAEITVRIVKFQEGTVKTKKMTATELYSIMREGDFEILDRD